MVTVRMNAPSEPNDMPDQPAITLRSPSTQPGDGSLAEFRHVLALITARLATELPPPVPSPPTKEAR